MLYLTRILLTYYLKYNQNHLISMENNMYYFYVEIYHMYLLPMDYIFLLTHSTSIIYAQVVQTHYLIYNFIPILDIFISIPISLILHELNLSLYDNNH